MNEPDKTDKWDLKEPLIKNWMTRDSICFLHTYENCGIVRRMEGWIRPLGIDNYIDPNIDKYISLEKGGCSGKSILSFP